MPRAKAAVSKNGQGAKAGPKRGRKPKNEDASEGEEVVEKPVVAKRGRKNDDEPKPAKRPKKGKKEESESEEEEETVTEPENGTNKKKAPKGGAKKPMMNKTSTDYSAIDFDCERKTEGGDSWNYKISSWNVDGIRAWLNKGGLEYIEHEKPDILCLQETKCSQAKLPPELKDIQGYHHYWASASKEGYSGVGIVSKTEPLSVKYGFDDGSDTEGRIITVEYEHFFLVNTYVPNAGRGLVTLPKRLEWNKVFRDYVKQLDEKKPVIVCGDMNVSHLEIDLANPKTNKKNAGFTQEERDGMTEFLGDGYKDTFRELYPDKTGAYTFWTYMSNSRAKNVGWRLDYYIVSERLMPSVCDNIIRNEVFGSDHCPITLFLHLKK